MSTLNDLKSLRSKLVADREAIDASLASLDRIIEQLSKDDAVQTLFDTGTASLKLKQGRRTIDAEVRDMADYAVANVGKLDFTLDELVAEKDFVASLADPTCVGGNLSAVWNNAITRMLGTFGQDESTKATLEDVSLAIAEGRDSKIAITSLSLKQKQADKKATLVSTHILVNKNTQSAVVIGACKVTASAEQKMRANGITYISQYDPKAMEKATAAIKTLTKSFSEVSRSNLTVAALYRIEGQHTDNLERLLTNPSSELIYDKYVIKAPKSKAA